MYPEIKSPLLRVFDNTSWCRLMLLPAGPCSNPRDRLPPGTGRCRAVPRHPRKHGANIETARSRPTRGKPSPLPGRALPAVWSAGTEAASVMNTIRNLRLHRQRDEGSTKTAAGRQRAGPPVYPPCTSDVPAGRRHPGQARPDRRGGAEDHWPIRGIAGQRSSTQLWHRTGPAAMSRRAWRNGGRGIDRRARVLSGEGGKS